MNTPPTSSVIRPAPIRTLLRVRILFSPLSGPAASQGQPAAKKEGTDRHDGQSDLGRDAAAAWRGGLGCSGRGRGRWRRRCCLCCRWGRWGRRGGWRGCAWCRERQGRRAPGGDAMPRVAIAGPAGAGTEVAVGVAVGTGVGVQAGGSGRTAVGTWPFTGVGAVFRKIGTSSTTSLLVMDDRA